MEDNAKEKRGQTGRQQRIVTQVREKKGVCVVAGVKADSILKEKSFEFDQLLNAKETV